jgi:hypothetical protein
MPYQHQIPTNPCFERNPCVARRLLRRNSRPSSLAGLEASCTLLGRRLRSTNTGSLPQPPIPERGNSSQIARLYRHGGAARRPGRISRTYPRQTVDRNCVAHSDRGVKRAGRARTLSIRRWLDRRCTDGTNLRRQCAPVAHQRGTGWWVARARLGLALGRLTSAAPLGAGTASP